MTVRDNDGSIVQFLYGEDSIDVTEMLFLEKFEFLEHNYGAFLKKYFSKSIMDCIDSVTIPEIKKKLKNDKKKGKEDELTSIISEYNPGRYLGSTSEKFAKNARKFHKKQKLINKDIPEF
jgi:DNA-directed RNA polymerase I subunit RPA1